MTDAPKPYTPEELENFRRLAAEDKLWHPEDVRDLLATLDVVTAERDALAAEVRAWRAREFDGGGPTGCGCEKCRALWGKAEQLWLANEAKGIPAPKEGG